MDNSDLRKDGKAITNEGLLNGGGGEINPGAAVKKAASQSRAPKAHFTPNDCARLIYARTILDHHYDQSYSAPLGGGLVSLGSTWSSQSLRSLTLPVPRRRRVLLAMEGAPRTCPVLFRIQ